MMAGPAGVGRKIRPYLYWAQIAPLFPSLSCLPVPVCDLAVKDCYISSIERLQQHIDRLLDPVFLKTNYTIT